MRAPIVWGITVMAVTAWVAVTLGATSALAGKRPPAGALPSAIVTTTAGPRAIAETSATLLGTVVRRGRTQYYFAWGPTRTYGSRTAWTLVRFRRSSAPAAAKIAGLTPSSTYHYRLVAASCDRCRPVYGADRVFMTAAVPVPPSVATGPPGLIAQTTVSLTGTVNPRGRPTSYRFEYGSTAAYGSRTSSSRAGSGTAAGAVSSALSRLSAVTAYHYRLVATSRAGTTYGADGSFTTGGYYQNPVHSPAAVPDPFVLDNGATRADYWAFGTGNLFPVLSSPDLMHWTARGAAMTSRPAWVVTSGSWHPWAPSVIQTDQPCPGVGSGGCYVMYYVGLSSQFNTNCIGVATSPTPGGPYIDQGPLGLPDPLGSIGTSATGPAMPLGCGDDSGNGNIDPSPFIDSSGQAYLYVSTDRTCTVGSCALQATISVIPLTPDLRHASAPRVALLSGTAATWEAAGLQTPTVEGPFMELHNGTYYLFYSGGNWQGAYGIGYATSTSPTGPFVKSAANPIFAQSSTVFGPGGGDRLVRGPHGGLWLLYAARDATRAGGRTLRLDPFTWQSAGGAGLPDVPMIGGPTSTPAPTQP